VTVKGKQQFTMGFVRWGSALVLVLGWVNRRFCVVVRVMELHLFE
jgi:hypothetical protein